MVKFIISTLIIFLSVMHPLIAQVKVEKRLITEKWISDPSKFEDDFHVTVTSLEAPYPSGEDLRNTIKERKLESAMKFPRVEGMNNSNSQRDEGDSLIVTEGFSLRNYFTNLPIPGGRPNDNTLAISNEGKLLASYNSQIWGYDITEDTFLFLDVDKHPSFASFQANYSNTSFETSFPFDPKLLYHPGLDRFIFLFLTGRDPEDSGVIVSFSSTNNPSDPWNTYYLSGNPLNDSTWTDYPQIAMNDHSLYLSLNQLYPDSSWITGFSQTIIWQMDLEDGFSGENLDTKLWSGANYNGSKLRYLRPVKNGMGPSGDEMYFVANRPFDIQNDTVFLVKIDGDVNSTSNNIEVEALKSNISYGLPPDAIQPNNHRFLTNDARALGAVRMQNEIQFVGNTVEPVSGKCAIYHGLIEDVTNPSLTAKIITHPTRDFGYPNIDFAGAYNFSRDVVVFFNHSSADDGIGNSAVFYNSNGTYGPIKSLVESHDYVDVISGTDERWGDYSGIQRKYNEDNTIWVAGYYSLSSNRPGTWISELSTPNTVTTSIQSPREQIRIKSFPNPTSDFVSMEFQLDQNQRVKIELLNLEGKLVRTLANAAVKKGRNELRFDLNPLESGVYFIRISSVSQQIAFEKVIKE